MSMSNFQQSVHYSYKHLLYKTLYISEECALFYKTAKNFALTRIFFKMYLHFYT